MYMDFNNLFITEPTRVTPTSSTLFDVIYTNCPDKIVCAFAQESAMSVLAIIAWCSPT